MFQVGSPFCLTNAGARVALHDGAISPPIYVQDYLIVDMSDSSHTPKTACTCDCTVLAR